MPTEEDLKAIVVHKKYSERRGTGKDRKDRKRKRSTSSESSQSSVSSAGEPLKNEKKPESKIVSNSDVGFIPSRFLKTTERPSERRRSSSRRREDDSSLISYPGYTKDVKSRRERDDGKHDSRAYERRDDKRVYEDEHRSRRDEGRRDNTDRRDEGRRGADDEPERNSSGYAKSSYTSSSRRESDRPERPERIDRPERTDRPDRPERIERPDRPERIERPDRPERIERPDRPSYADQHRQRRDDEPREPREPKIESAYRKRLREEQERASGKRSSSLDSNKRRGKKDEDEDYDPISDEELAMLEEDSGIIEIYRDLEREMRSKKFSANLEHIDFTTLDLLRPEVVDGVRKRDPIMRLAKCGYSASFGGKLITDKIKALSIQKGIYAPLQGAVSANKKTLKQVFQETLSPYCALSAHTDTLLREKLNQMSRDKNVSEIILTEEPTNNTLLMESVKLFNQLAGTNLEVK